MCTCSAKSALSNDINNDFVCDKVEKKWFCDYYCSSVVASQLRIEYAYNSGRVASLLVLDRLQLQANGWLSLANLPPLGAAFFDMIEIQ